MNNLIFTTRDELIRIDISKMIYAEAAGNYVDVHFINGQITMIATTLTNFGALITKMAPETSGRYIRISRKYIVDSRYIMHINHLNQQLVLSDMQTIRPIILKVPNDTLKELKKTMMVKFDVQKDGK